MKKILLIIGITIILFSSLVIAEKQDYVTVKTSFNYVLTVPDGGTPYLQNYSLYFPSGADSIISFTLTLYGDWDNAVVSGVVNTDEGIVYCTPTTWQASNIDGYKVKFDCTNTTQIEFNKKKSEVGEAINYLEINGIGLEVSKDVDNVYGDIEITYLDMGESTMKIFGTDYRRGDTGTIFLQLLNANNSAINNRYCDLTSYWPNKTMYHDDVVLNYLNDSQGLYYYDFTVPNVVGVYMLSSVCHNPSWSWTDDFNDYSKLDYYENITVSGGNAALTESYPGWYNISWEYRKNITIPASKISSSLTFFPLLVDIYDTDLRNNAQADGDDILFLDVNDNKLAHEIELFDQTYNATHARLVAWVRSNLSSGSDNVIYMYYENPTAINQQSPPTVWDNNYMMVQHLQETDIDGGAGDIKDSTSNGNNGTTVNMGVSNQVEGRIDGSMEFDGVNEYIGAGSAASLDVTQGTYSMWLNWEDDSGVLEIPLAKDNVGFNLGDGSIHIHGESTNGVMFMAGSAFGENEVVSDSAITPGEWVHVVGVSGTGGMLLYIDGVVQADTDVYTGGWSNAAASLLMGSRRAGTDEFDGILDEIRISNIRRSADWINTTFWNKNDSNFLSLTSQTTYESDIVNGYLQSIPINLTEYSWFNFSADYNLNQGNISFEVRNASNNVTLCTELGSIESCANSNPSITLYANFSIPNSTATSPELDRWILFSATGENINEIRGAGEINVLSWVDSNGLVSVNAVSIAQAVWNYNGTILASLLNQFAPVIASDVWTYVTRTLTGFSFEVNSTVDDATVANITEDVWNYSARYTHGVDLT